MDGWMMVFFFLRIWGRGGGRTLGLVSIFPRSCILGRVVCRLVVSRGMRKCVVGRKGGGGARAGKTLRFFYSFLD